MRLDVGPAGDFRMLKLCESNAIGGPRPIVGPEFVVTGDGLPTIETIINHRMPGLKIASMTSARSPR